MDASDVFTDSEYSEMAGNLAETDKDSGLFHAIVNTPFQHKKKVVLLNLGIIVLLLVDEQKRLIKRIALTNNELADGAKNMSVKRFEDIGIPLDEDQNIIAAAIRTQKPMDTTDWKYLFIPDLTAQEARLNQAGGGIAYSAVYPLTAPKVQGALIFSYHQYPQHIDETHERFMSKYTAVVTHALAQRSITL